MGVIDLAHADEIASKTHNDEAEYDSKKGLLVGIYAIILQVTQDSGPRGYLSLLTLLGGLFGVQTASWSKAGAGGKHTKLTKVSYIYGIAVAVFACVILYIVMPNIKK